MTNHDDFHWLLVAVVATVVLVFLAALFVAGQSNAERQQEFKLACLQAGGSYVEDACLSPRGPLP